MENHLTTTQVAAYMGISPDRVLKLIRDGRLPSAKRGRDYVIRRGDVETFTKHEKKPGRPTEKQRADGMAREHREPSDRNNASNLPPEIRIGKGRIYAGDALEILPQLARDSAQVIIADPPYFQVLNETWDNAWHSEDDYLDFTAQWVKKCNRILCPDGLLYIFGQLGKREHVWLHACSMLAKEMQFHDMIVWDRAVGYNDRKDSFTPQYEMILVLRKSHNAKPFFDKDAVRLPYEKEKIQTYLRDKRYKDKQARERHLQNGKYATNILRIPSLKGSSKEKAGHPSQKPIALINHLIRASSRVGDLVVDPFLGSGTTAESAENNGRHWIGIEKHNEYVAMAKRRIERNCAQNELSLD